MRVLLDENLPKDLKRILAPHDVLMVKDMNWAGVKNGELIALAEAHFDVFLTADKNLRYQQNLSHRKIAIVELPSNRWPQLRDLGFDLSAAISTIAASTERYLVYLPVDSK